MMRAVAVIVALCALVEGMEMQNKSTVSRDSEQQQQPQQKESYSPQGQRRYDDYDEQQFGYKPSGEPLAQHQAYRQLSNQQLAYAQQQLFQRQQQEQQQYAKQHHVYASQPKLHNYYPEKSTSEIAPRIFEILSSPKGSVETILSYTGQAVTGTIIGVALLYTSMFIYNFLLGKFTTIEIPIEGRAEIAQNLYEIGQEVYRAFENYQRYRHGTNEML